MKRLKLIVPEQLEVCGYRYVFVDPPLYWTEDIHRELSCDRCGRPLTVRFAYRNMPGADRNNDRWWVPTSVTCNCPGVEVAVRATLRLYRKRKKDSCQPELNFAPQHTAELFPQ